MEVDNANGCAELTEAESELYDRQIRLWGLESQKRLRIAKVLISGLSGIGAEVTKNIILSGVNSVKLHDCNVVTEEDFCSQFLAARTSLGENRATASIQRAKVLNPMVDISADTEPLEKKDEEFFAAFDVVLLIGAPNSELLRVDEICRKRNIKFFAGDVWGTFGFCFADLQRHSFVEDVAKHKIISKPGEKIKTDLVTSTVKREVSFPPFSAVLQYDINAAAFKKRLKRTGPALILLRVLLQFREQFQRDPSYKSRDDDILKLQTILEEVFDESLDLRDYFDNIFAEISPAAAVVGGVLAQEVIKALSGKEAPHCNVFLFDPETCCGFIETLGAQ